jgi:hypothetical protein
VLLDKTASNKRREVQYEGDAGLYGYVPGLHGEPPSRTRAVTLSGGTFMAQLLHHRPTWAGGVLCLLLTAGCAHPLTAGAASARPSTAPPSPTAAAATPPGHDHALHDANARTRPYVTDRVYAQIVDPQTRTSAARWQQLRAAGAVTSVNVEKVAVPEGAPAPSGQQAEVRITYTVTTTGQDLHNTQTLSQGMQVSATPAGWRVDQLLAF